MNADKATIRIDAHHHVWDLAVRDQPWTAELPTLRRTFLIEDLDADLTAQDIEGTILVQTVCVPEETPEFLEMAAKDDRIRGVVGWVDLTSPDVRTRLADLARLPGGDRLVGIRHQVQLEPDPEWLLREDVIRGLQSVADAGLVYELLVTHDQLPAAVAVVEQVPGLRFVLDHAGKPPIASSELDPWRERIAALAANPNVACKLSGLVTEAGPDWKPEHLEPYAAHVLAAFGADRVMFGSDWPVCLLQTSYAGVVELTARFCEGLSDAEWGDVWGGTAQRWYGLR